MFARKILYLIFISENSHKMIKVSSQLYPSVCFRLKQSRDVFFTRTFAVGVLLVELEHVLLERVHARAEKVLVVVRAKLEFVRKFLVLEMTDLYRLQSLVRFLSALLFFCFLQQNWELGSLSENCTICKVLFVETRANLQNFVFLVARRTFSLQ